MSFTIVDSIIEHAQSRPEAIAFQYLSDLEQTPHELTYQGLLQEAGAIALLLGKIAAPGDRIMLFFPPGMAYIKAFYGCLLAGMVAVPLYPPRRNSKSDRLIKVAQSCRSVVALTTLSELALVRAAWQEQNGLGLQLDFHATDGIVFDENAPFVRPATNPDAIAFLQYTSGSTGTPKGVMVSHQNIIANVRHLSTMSTGNSADVFVNWLPLFHDLGLITAVLWPVYLGAISILMAPAVFVREPLIWLKAITRYRGSMCGAPNFAYDLCVSKIADRDLAGLDLSSWRVAYNAAEPVRAGTLEAFQSRFAACGLPPAAFYPAYGMAEATVLITGGNAAAVPPMLVANKQKLAEKQLCLVEPGHEQATRIVACGNALAPHQVCIVDPESCTALPDGKVGEIWFAGPSVSPGYWQLDELNQQTFDQKIAGNDSGTGFLRTGDLGVMWQGELYVTGRIKDLIILRGRNYYPQDIELSVAGAHPAIREGAIAAFAVTGHALERLVVVAEIEREHFRSIAPDEVIHAIRKQVAQDHDITPDQVILLKPYRIPQTSSGKIQRRQTRQMLLDGELELIADSNNAPRRSMVAPRTTTEQVVHTVWRTVLKNDDLCIHDHFFEVGGDSMAAIDMAAQLSAHFAGTTLESIQLQDYPTVATFAGLLDLKAIQAAARSAGGANQQNTMLIL